MRDLPDSISHVWSGGSAEGKLVGQILLGSLGVLLAAAGAWGYFAGRNDQIVGGFFVVVGVLAVVIAAFYSHIDEMVELGLLKIPSSRARRAEKQVEQGRIVAADELERAGRALDETLARYKSASEESVGSVLRELSALDPDRGRHIVRTVLLVEDAVFTIATLAAHERALVVTEVARMGAADFQPELDLRETRSGKYGHSYRMHRLPESDIRLWYRQKSASEPHTLYVLVVEKTDEDH